MANPITKILAWLCNVIVASSRVLLFLGCTVLMVIQGFRISDAGGKMVKSYQVQPLPPATDSYNPYYNPIGMAVVALIGVASSLFKHRFFRVFPLLLILCIVGVSYELRGSFFNQTEMLKTLREFDLKFNRSMSVYDWSHKDPTTDPTKNTLYVDTIQMNSCCGLLEASDWDQLRPSSRPRDTFPATCCAADLAVDGKLDLSSECLRETAKKYRGCSEQFWSILEWISFMGLLHLVYLVLLTPIALISQSSCCSDKGSRKERSYMSVAYHS